MADTTPADDAMAVEREKFEAWAQCHGFNVHDTEIHADGEFARYLNDSTQDAWDGWQAHAALIAKHSRDTGIKMEVKS